MKILALEGALGSFSCALIIDGQEFSEQLDGKVALEQGLTLVQTLLARSGLCGPDIDRIAVGCGPGSFTGLRVALSYAKSLAQAWSLPLVALSSFDIITSDVSELPVLTAVQPRAGLISARLREQGRERRASGPIAEALQRLLAGFSGPCLTVINPAKDVLAAVGERANDVRILPAQTFPPALSLARLARRAVPAPNLHSVRADYGELPAARIPRLP